MAEVYVSSLADTAVCCCFKLPLISCESSRHSCYGVADTTYTKPSTHTSRQTMSEVCVGGGCVRAEVHASSFANFWPGDEASKCLLDYSVSSICLPRRGRTARAAYSRCSSSVRRQYATIALLIHLEFARCQSEFLCARSEACFF